MVSKLVIAAALAAIAVAPAAHAQVVSQSTLLMPGVTYNRQVEFTPRGPVVLDVVTAPKPDGSLYTLAPALSNETIVGTEKLTDIEKRLSAAATVVGVNGDFFAANPGKPNGIVMRSGALDSAPMSTRSSLGIGADGTLSVARVVFDGTWRGNGQRRQLDLNASPVRGTRRSTRLHGARRLPPRAASSIDVIAVAPLARPEPRRSRASSRRSDAAARRRSRRAARCSSRAGTRRRTSPPRRPRARRSRSGRR